MKNDIKIFHPEMTEGLQVYWDEFCKITKALQVSDDEKWELAWHVNHMLRYAQTVTLMQGVEQECAGGYRSEPGDKVDFANFMGSIQDDDLIN